MDNDNRRRIAMPAGGREALKLRFRQLLIDEVQSRRDETSERKVP